MDALANHLTAIGSMRLLNLVKISLQTRTTDFVTRNRKLRFSSALENVKLMIVTENAMRHLKLNFNDVRVRQNVEVNQKLLKISGFLHGIIFPNL